MLKEIYHRLASTVIQKMLYTARMNVKYFGSGHYCPACQRPASRFLDFDMRSLHGENGVIPPIVVPDTRCPWCGSHLHHRLMWTVLPDLLAELTSHANNNTLRILHFAPEKFSIPRLQKLRDIKYITTDFLREDVHVKFDMCRLGLATECIDLVIASHVLEHVPNDVFALNELFRILRPGGGAVLLVPLLAEKSFELDNVTTDAERLSLYGQEDHVRAYGIDFADRISSCGFEVEIIRARDFATLNRPSYLLDIQGILFFAHKPLKNHAKCLKKVQRNLPFSVALQHSLSHCMLGDLTSAIVIADGAHQRHAGSALVHEQRSLCSGVRTQAG